MWTDKSVSPVNYVSLFMLAIYVCIAFFLFAKLRSLDVSTMVKSLVGSEEKSKETASRVISNDAGNDAKKLAGDYADTIFKEMNSDLKRVSVGDNTYMPIKTGNSLSELIKLDGRLAMAPTIEPYFARR